jgi:hypothetical protein
MLDESLKYSLLVFIAAVGVLQSAGTYSGRPGYSFFKSKVPAGIFALITTGGSLAAFFVWNYWSKTGVVEGSQQFGLFVLSALLALAFTFFVSGLINGKILKYLALNLNLSFFRTPDFVKRWRKRKEKIRV